MLSERADLDGNGQPDEVGIGNFHGGGNVVITLFDALFPEDTVRSSFVINIDDGFSANLLLSLATLNAGGTASISGPGSTAPARLLKTQEGQPEQHAANRLRSAPCVRLDGQQP